MKYLIFPIKYRKVKRDTPVGEEIVSDIKVSYKGKYAGDIFYTVYDEDGKEIVSKSKVLKIPTGEIESCIVKINVFWDSGHEGKSNKNGRNW